MKNLESERIENYLEGKLTAAEREDFEKEITLRPELREELEAQAEVINTLGRMGERAAFKKQLEAIHTEMEKESRPSKVVSLWKRYYPTIAVAAVVSLFTVITMLATTEFWIGWRKPKAVYKELRRDLDKIRQAQQAQQAIIKDIRSVDNTKEYNPGRYGGTGFAVSSNGYVVTSYHLIKDAEQLVIENSKGEVYTARAFYNDPAHDLAILKVTDSTFTSFGTIPYALKAKEADLGEKIFTLGYPKEDIVFGEGSISSKSGYEGDTVAYQVSVPVNPGNSGGPVFDENGNLVAVISGKQLNTDGAAFAIKSSYLLSAINSIPKDSLKTPFRLPKVNHIANKSRVKQLKTIEELVFIVKVYN